LSDTVGWDNFLISDYLTEPEHAQLVEAGKKLREIETTRGIEIDAAWFELGEAGYCKAWELLMGGAWEKKDYEESTKFFRLAIHSAWNTWDILTAAVARMEHLGQQVIGEAKQPISSKTTRPEYIAEASELVRSVTEHVYPESHTLALWLEEDEPGTRAVLTRAGYVMNLHLALALSGEFQSGGAPGAVAWGLLLRIEFGTQDQKVEAELALRAMASADAYNSIALSEYEPIQQKMIDLGLAWWAEERAKQEIDFFKQLGVEATEDRPGSKRFTGFSLKVGIIFLRWWDSRLGVELLDIRVVVLQNIPKKTPNLLALIETFQPITVGQWLFYGDDDQGHNLTFGVQLPRAVLNAQTMATVLDFLSEKIHIGSEILDEMAADTSSFPDTAGILWMSAPSDGDKAT
jgi:hypothetical protein